VELVCVYVSMCVCVCVCVCVCEGVSAIHALVSLYVGLLLWLLVVVFYSLFVELGVLFFTTASYV